MRSKEEANDYRYFPDPDLLPIEISPDFIDEIKTSLPELPDARQKRIMKEYKLSEYDSSVITSSRDMADFYESTAKAACSVASLDVKSSKLTANWIMGEFSAALNRNNLDIKDSPVNDEMLGELIKRIDDNTISNIEKLVDEVIADSTLQVEQYRNSPVEKQGKLIGYFVGQVMKKSRGKANPKQVNELLRNKLAKD